MRLGLAAIAATMLFGCANVPVANDRAKLVPPDRILSRELTTNRSDTGHIIVKRDQGIMGAGCTIRVFVAGAPAFDIRTEERGDLYLDPGTYVISAKSTGFCGTFLAESEAIVAAGDSKVYRITFYEWAVVLQPTAF